MAFYAPRAADGQEPADRIIYVNSAATGINDGSSWKDAYVDIQDALDDARLAGDLHAEIWIAAGTYKPDRGTGDQSLAFELFGNVALYGGFGGWEECRDQRDSRLNLTVLSGDLHGDDDPDAQPTSDCCQPGYTAQCSDAECRAAVLAEDSSCATRWRQACNSIAVKVCCALCRPTRCDNSYNLVRAEDPGSTPLLDGVTVAGGEALGSGLRYTRGGGIFAQYSSPRIDGCSFQRNNAFDGSAVFVRFGSPVVQASSFTQNGRLFPSWHAVRIGSPQAPLSFRRLTVANNIGGGLGIDGADATIEDSSLVNNWGSGLDCFSSDCTVLNSQVVGNTGYGMYADGFTQIINSLFLGNLFNGLFTLGPTVIVNSVFAGNTAGFAAAVDSYFGGLYVLNSVFCGNSADSIGGVGVGDGGATFVNSIFWGNSDNTGFTQRAQFYSNGTIDVHYSIVQGWTGSWGGVGNSGADPMFVDPIGLDGIAGSEDDDLRLSPGSPAINTGDPNTAGLPLTDLDGHGRVLCGRVDIGAYEFGIGDYNCDQTVNLADFANWPACMTGPVSGPLGSGCEAFDFNSDDGVDLHDYYLLSHVFTAP